MVGATGSGVHTLGLEQEEVKVSPSTRLKATFHLRSGGRGHADFEGGLEAKGLDFLADEASPWCMHHKRNNSFVAMAST